jgi:hypothetical protein
LKSYKKFLPSKAGANQQFIKNHENNYSILSKKDSSGPHWKIGMNQQTTKKCEKAEHSSMIKPLSEKETRVNKKEEESFQLENLKTNSLLQRTKDDGEAKRLSEFNKSSTKIWDAIINKSSIIAFQTASKLLNHNLIQDTSSDKSVQSQRRMPINGSIESYFPKEKTNKVSKAHRRKLFYTEVDQILESLASDSMNLNRREKSEKSPPIYLK